MKIYKPSYKSRLIIISFSILSLLLFIIFSVAGYYSTITGQKILFGVLSLAFFLGFITFIFSFFKFLSFEISLESDFINLESFYKRAQYKSEDIKSIEILDNKIIVSLQSLKTITFSRDFNNFETLKSEFVRFKNQNKIT